jgi:hypothetical protein
MSLTDNYIALRKEISGDIIIVAVSKTKPAEMIKLVYDAGHRDFGENRVQEMVSKHEVLPPDIRWHLIGHLQTNKVKYIAPFVSVIHSVDSMKLLSEINKEARKNGRIIDCLLQFHIATEETKFGLSLEEAIEILENHEVAEMKNVNICGVMGMATFTEDESLVAKEFRNLKSIFNVIRAEFFTDDQNFREISMGMSGDFRIAIAEGSTMVRIGSLIFGER